MDLINKKILGAKYTSFVLDGVLVEKYMTLHLNFEGIGWFNFSVMDGISKVTKENRDLDIESYVIKESDGFEYPTFDCDDRLFTNKKIISLQEYLWQGIKEESAGLLFSLGNNDFVSYAETADEAIILSQSVYPMDPNFILSPIMQNDRVQ
jgi:hypothetical protein